MKIDPQTLAQNGARSATNALLVVVVYASLNGATAALAGPPQVPAEHRFEGRYECSSGARVTFRSPTEPVTTRYDAANPMVRIEVKAADVGALVSTQWWANGSWSATSPDHDYLQIRYLQAEPDGWGIALEGEIGFTSMSGGLMQLPAGADFVNAQGRITLQLTSLGGLNAPWQALAYCDKIDAPAP